MRALQGQVTAEPFGGAFRLRIKTVTGEVLSLQLSPEQSAELRRALSPVVTEAAEDPAAEPAPSAKPKPRRR